MKKIESYLDKEENEDYIKNYGFNLKKYQKLY